MAEKKPTLQEYKVDGTKIKVFVSADEWLEFESDNWMFGEYMRFTKAVATEYMVIMLKRIVAWHIKDDVTGAWVEFNRDFLIDHLEELNITAQKQTAMVTAYFRAYNIASTLETEKK